MGHVRKVPSKRQAVVDDDTKLNLLLALEENPITPALVPASSPLAEPRPPGIRDTDTRPPERRSVRSEGSILDNAPATADSSVTTRVVFKYRNDSHCELLPRCRGTKPPPVRRRWSQKKEKESSFKRSDSFKRISIRKSYLDRGKKKHISKLEVATQTVAEEGLLSNGSEEAKKVDSSVQVDKLDLKSTAAEFSPRKVAKTTCSYKNEVVSKSGPGQSVIAYGQWLKGIRKDDTPTPSGIKGSERTIIYVPASDERAPSPVIRQLSSSPVFRKKSPLARRRSKPVSPNLQRKESNDSAVEMFPWGDSTDAKKSPLVRRRSRQSPAPLMPDSGTEELCSLSISLGRIWMDAPQVMAPRSLEMPKASGPAPPAHHSLDSALKDLRDDAIVINRLQKRPTPPVGRTLSSTSNTTASTGLFSSKDSGFSFSISAPKLSDFHANFVPSASRGFFRKKRPKPKLSVSRDGYFKRTSGALVVEAKRNSLRRRSSNKKKGKESKSKKGNKASSTTRGDLYQVVVGRPPRSLRALKLDPMIFVPPEKRKPSVTRKPSYKVGMREIRNVNPHDAAIYSTRSGNDSADEGLYESLPGDFDYLSDDRPLSGRVSCISLRDDDVTGGRVASSRSEEAVAANVATSDDDGGSSKCASPYVPPGVSPVPRRRPVRRKKSTLSHKRSITYVVKPTIIRAPSTLRRPTKKLVNNNIPRPSYKAEYPAELLDGRVGDYTSARAGMRQSVIRVVCGRFPRPKRIWTRPWILRRDNGGSSTLLRELEEEDLKELKSFMRMNLEQFECLLDGIAPTIQKQDTVI
ncbi:hypothetical protein NQ318_018993 [Aromia moschata]|uniref:Uncharacterized protein n=1 Tax=Aromia moschata TaxID=1265417 RepID=A0AAV8Y761_9CUCU|nr:hypothetical protein NQ318_018993 [Aromia moschata]